MIQWLVQSHADMAPAGFLSEVEQARFAALKSDKRRQDWLLGRWTAKRLLQTMVGGAVPLTNLVIENDGDGVPTAQLLGYDFSLSISHCDGWAFCAAVSRPGIALGADMEKMEPRLPTFASDYFTPAEQEQLAKCRPAHRPTLENAIWSGKEAALKAIHLGLSVDTRAITCLFPAGALRPEHWQPFTIHYDQALLPNQKWPPLSGRWRVMGHYVLTLALEQNLSSEIESE